MRGCHDSLTTNFPISVTIDEPRTKVAFKCMWNDPSSCLASPDLKGVHCSKVIGSFDRIQIRDSSYRTRFSRLACVSRETERTFAAPRNLSSSEEKVDLPEEDTSRNKQPGLIHRTRSGRWRSDKFRGCHKLRYHEIYIGRRGSRHCYRSVKFRHAR